MSFSLRYDWSAEAALSSLYPIEREHLQAEVERLRNGQFLGLAGVRHLKDTPEMDELYMLPVDDLIVVFTAGAGQQITVRDIINRQLVVNCTTSNR